MLKCIVLFDKDESLPLTWHVYAVASKGYERKVYGQPYKWQFIKEGVDEVINIFKKEYNIQSVTKTQAGVHYTISVSFTNEEDEAAFVLLASDGGITLEEFAPDIYVGATQYDIGRGQ